MYLIVTANETHGVAPEFKALTAYLLPLVLLDINLKSCYVVFSVVCSIIPIYHLFHHQSFSLRPLTLYLLLVFTQEIMDSQKEGVVGLRV